MLETINTVWSPILLLDRLGIANNTEAVVFGIDVKCGIDYLSRSFKEDFDPEHSESLGTFALNHRVITTLHLPI
jgi:hypothetical protein